MESFKAEHSKQSFTPPPEQKVRTSLKQATSMQYFVDLIPIHSSYRCSLNYLILNKVNMQDDNTQLRIKVHETQLSTHKIMRCSHRCKTTIGNYRRQCNHSVRNNTRRPNSNTHDSRVMSVITA